MPATSGQHLFEIALDTDETSATGCALDFPTQGSLSGFEALVELRVDPNYFPPRVDSIRLVPCQANGWDLSGTITTSAGGWGAGVEDVTGEGDFVEGFVPLDLLGSPNSLRLAVRSISISGGTDDIDSQVASPLVLDLTSAVPALEPMALFLLAGVLLGAGFLLRGRHSLRVLVVLLALGVGIRAVQAAPLAETLSGLEADWAGIAPLASDPKGDANDPAADLLAFFAQIVGAELVFRFDLGDLERACNAPGDLACDSVCGIFDTDPGDCNGVCEVADAATVSADCDGICEVGDEAGSFDCVVSGGDCDASPPPANGGVGNCTSSLEDGSTCQPTCDTDYDVSGVTSCSAGVLTAATCSCTPVNGGWSAYEAYDACNATNDCGAGTQTRTRTCTNPAPNACGVNCSGPSTETVSCDQGNSTCGWGVYGSFGACSASCGGGTQTQTRACSTGSAGSAHCAGSNTNSQACNTQACLNYVLLRGEELTSNESISSPNDVCQLVMQTDGNVVIYCNGQSHISFWFPTNTVGFFDSRLVFDANDGKLVVYNAVFLPVWSNIGPFPTAATMDLTDNGVLYIRNGNGIALWSSLLEPGGPGGGCDMNSCGPYPECCGGPIQ